MPVSEFDIIEQVFKANALTGENVICGIGDDAAIIEVPVGQQLLVSTDTLVSGVHFFSDADPYDIGYKSLAVNLSDMAAMAASPAWMTLALTLPDNDLGWLRKFADGLFALANQYKVALIGGNIAHGPLSITITIMGTVPSGQALKRSAAKPGDDIYVTGQLGMAAYALAILEDKTSRTTPPQACLERLNRPAPRVRTGIAVRSCASAGIDISDGLAADLAHMLKASAVGARIELAAIPAYEMLKKLDEDAMWKYALCSGDDYELCFTVPTRHRPLLEQAMKNTDCGFTRIGQISSEPGIRWLAADGSDRQISGSGYRHF